MPDLKASIRITLVDEANRAAARINTSFTKLAATTKGLGQVGSRASSAVARLAQSQAAAKAESAQLSNKLASLRASGTASQAEIAQLSGRIAQLSSIEAQAAGKIAQFEGKLQKLSGTGELSAAAVRKLEADVAGLAARADSAGSRLERMVKGTSGVGAGLSKAATSTGKAGRGFGRLTKEQRAANLAFAEGINLTTELGFGVLGLSKKTMPLGIALASAGNNAFSFARFLGPVGIGIGVLGSALPGLIGLFTDWGDETEDAARATSKLNKEGKFTVNFFRDVKTEISEAAGATSELLSLIDSVTKRSEDRDLQESILAGKAGLGRTQAALVATKIALTGEGAESVEQQKASVVGKTDAAAGTLGKVLRKGGLSREAVQETLEEASRLAARGKLKDPASTIKSTLIRKSQERAGVFDADGNIRAGKRVEAATIRKEVGAIVDQKLGGTKGSEAVGVLTAQSNRARRLHRRRVQLENVAIPEARRRDAKEKATDARASLSDRIQGLLDIGLRQASLGGANPERLNKAVELANRGDFGGFNRVRGVDPELLAVLKELVALQNRQTPAEAARLAKEANDHLRKISELLGTAGGPVRSPLDRARGGEL